MLEHMFQLPYQFCVPDLLFEKELKGEFGDRLIQCGLDVVELSSAELRDAIAIHGQSGKLSFPDTFAYSLAKNRAWTLLTGDGALRKLARDEQLSMHGVLWIIERYHEEGILHADALRENLMKIRQHPRCRLPSMEVGRLLSMFQNSPDNN